MISTPRNPFGPAVTIALFFCIFEMGPLFPIWTRVFFAIINITAFTMFAIDKGRAVGGKWRIQESHLHWVTLAGGFAGAQLAKSMFRHKTQKPSFHLVFWLSAFVWGVIGGAAYSDHEMSRYRNDVKRTAGACPTPLAASA